MKQFKQRKQPAPQNYQWRYPSMFRVSADEIGERLDELVEQYGGQLSKETILHEALDIDSPLHACFEWNDRNAANAYRRSQVRQLMSNLMIARTRRRAFLNVRPDGKATSRKAYVPSQRVIQSPTLRKQLELRFYRDLQNIRNRYEAIAELRPVLTTLQTLLRERSEPAIR